MAITLQELKDATGFDSFFEAYKWLKQFNHENAEYVTYRKGASWERVSIIEIKAAAMDEVYNRLPSAVQMQFIIRVLGYHLPVTAPADIRDCLEKMPYKL